jgi:sodium/proline symporter
LGAATVILWKNLSGSQLYEMVPGVIVATIAVVVGSLLSPSPSARVLKTHDDVSAELARVK